MVHLPSIEINRSDAAMVYAVPMAVDQTQEPSQSTGAPVYGEPLTTATVSDGAPAYGKPLTTAYVAGEARRGDQTYIYARPRAIGGKCLAFYRMFLWACQSSCVLGLAFLLRVFMYLMDGAVVH